jgi:hypothetical protein
MHLKMQTWGWIDYGWGNLWNSAWRIPILNIFVRNSDEQCFTIVASLKEHYTRFTLQVNYSHLLVWITCFMDDYVCREFRNLLWSSLHHRDHNFVSWEQVCPVHIILLCWESNFGCVIPEHASCIIPNDEDLKVEKDQSSFRSWIHSEKW